MQIQFIVTVDVERESGKFISKDEIAENLIETLSDSDPGEVGVDDSTYSITGWDVERTGK